MADNYNIYKLCPHCSGDGKRENTPRDGETVEVECESCGGTGEYLWGKMKEEAIE